MEDLIMTIRKYIILGLAIILTTNLPLAAGNPEQRQVVYVQERPSIVGSIFYAVGAAIERIAWKPNDGSINNLRRLTATAFLGAALRNGWKAAYSGENRCNKGHDHGKDDRWEAAGKAFLYGVAFLML